VKRTYLFILISILIAQVAISSEIVLLEPVSIRQRGPVLELDELDEITNLERFTSDAEYYLSSGEEGDTLAVVFNPADPCSIYYAWQQWFSSGDIEVYIWDYSDDAEEEYPTGRAPDRGTSEVSPLGEILAGPFETASVGTGGWEVLLEPDDLEDGGIEWDGSMFLVGWVKTQDDGLPQPLADDVTQRRFSYTWFGGPWMDDNDEDWGSYSSDIEGGTVVDLMMRVGVSFFEGAAPWISAMSSLPNTINPEKECTVTALITDDTGWDEDEAFLIVLTDDDSTAIAMEEAEEDDLFSVTFDLSDFDIETGDEISYYIMAIDEEDNVRTNSDNLFRFSIVELDNPEADLLIVDEGMGDRANVLVTWLDDNDVSYEWWDVYENNGIDEFTVEADFPNVWVIGWGVESVPTREYGDDPYSGFIEDGGNFLLVDMDYFFANGEDLEPVFSEDDFAYDFLGIEDGVNDPFPTDSVFYGEEDDIISGDFEDDPYETFPQFSGDFVDGIGSVRDESTVFFEGEEEGYGTAVRTIFDRQKIMYFAFDIVSACEEDGNGELIPTDQCEDLLEILVDWYLTPMEPEIFLEDTTFDFGSVLISDSETWDMQIENAGSYELNIFSIESDNPLFEVEDVDEFIIDPNDDESIEITFTPETLGSDSAVVTITSDDPDEDTVFVLLYGIGAEPDIFLPDNRYDFGVVAVDSSSEWSMWIINRGNYMLTVNSVESDNRSFSVDDVDDDVVEPGDSMAVEIVYTPDRAGLDSAHISILCDDPDEEELSVTLFGTGDIPEPPSSFNLLQPENGDSLSLDESRNIIATWEESVDPDTFDIVRYDAFFRTRSMSGYDSLFKWDGLETTSFEFSLFDTLYMYWDEYLQVTWWVEAISNVDTLESEDRFTFYVEPNTGISEDPFGGIPTEYSIAATYPNPFNPVLSIVIAVPLKSELNAQVYNILGEQVGMLADGIYAAGYHKIIFDGQNLSSGIYFIHADVPGKMNEVRKVVLMR